MKDVRVLFSTLWIFYVFNSAYGDITTLYNSVYINPVSSIHYTQAFVLFGALLVEPAILMVLLSRILSNPANRWANIVVGALLTVVNVATLFVGTPTLAYAFITSVMIVTGVAIVWSAWKWTGPAEPLLEAAPRAATASVAATPDRVT
jgi:Family of unknown function (DUF6326)